ncbi:MAG TPA: class I SAM-dependent methyltransferase [Verrucomicrobiae bacterium]|nr:class I SAM-dependent methyltransferase [Verrucomicrobiae bacterium]
MSSFHQKSSFTADGVAYRRTFADIPLSKEIWDALLEIQGPPPDEEMAWMNQLGALPFFEARYRLTDRELIKSGFRQILELAPGLSGRGILMTQSPEMIYVEMDLPDKIATKQKVIGQLLKRKQIEPRQNLFLEPGNVVDENDFRRASAHFRDDEPVAVVCEGLLRYLSFSDKEILAGHIRRLIKRAGGLWITPDIEYPVKNSFTNGSLHLKKITGLSVQSNLFRDETHAETFFDSLGFTVSKIPVMEMAKELACVKKFNVGHKHVQNVLGNRWTYLMR